MFFNFSTNEPKLLRSMQMKSLKPGKSISVSVENITPFDIWIFVKEKEYFLSYKDYPYFKAASGFLMDSPNIL
jgi:hypothetical protein